MQFKNTSGKFQCFPIPQQDGSPLWFNVESNNMVEVPDSEGWRAKASGLVLCTKTGELIVEKPKGNEVKDLKIIKKVLLEPVKPTKVVKKKR